MHRTGLIWWIVVIRGDVAAQCLARDALELVGFSNDAFITPEGLKLTMDRLADALTDRTGP